MVSYHKLRDTIDKANEAQWSVFCLLILYFYLSVHITKLDLILTSARGKKKRKAQESIIVHAMNNLSHKNRIRQTD